LPSAASCVSLYEGKEIADKGYGNCCDSVESGTGMVAGSVVAVVAGCVATGGAEGIVCSELAKQPESINKTEQMRKNT